MRTRQIVSLFTALLALSFAGLASASSLSQRQIDAQIVAALRLEGSCVKSEHVIVCASIDALTNEELREFLSLAEDGAQRIRSYLGEHLDLPKDNARPVEFFISRDVGIPHATSHHEPWIFIHPVAIRKKMAPYLHEMVHAMAQWSWRNSEWVAEGYANYVASAVAVGHSGYHRSFILPVGLDNLLELHASRAGTRILPLIGLPGRRHTYEDRTRELAQLLRTERRDYAPPYYAMSWSFVSYLVDVIGHAGLRRVAESSSPSSTLQELTGKSMQEQLMAWERQITKGRRGNG